MTSWCQVLRNVLLAQSEMRSDVVHVCLSSCIFMGKQRYVQGNVPARCGRPLQRHSGCYSCVSRVPLSLTSFLEFKETRIIFMLVIKDSVFLWALKGTQ
jgi:hypothetical protein